MRARGEHDVLRVQRAAAGGVRRRAAAAAGRAGVRVRATTAATGRAGRGAVRTEEERVHVEDDGQGVEDRGPRHGGGRHRRRERARGEGVVPRFHDGRGRDDQVLEKTLRAASGGRAEGHVRVPPHAGG